MPKILTPREAADRLEVCTRTVTRGVRAGILRAKYGGLRKDRIVGIYAEDVEKLSRQTSGQTTRGNV
jgi:hypothetical protein